VNVVKTVSAPGKTVPSAASPAAQLVAAKLQVGTAVVQAMKTASAPCVQLTEQ
jgi:hypothetical protein